MNQSSLPHVQGRVVEEEIRFSLRELCHACGADEEELTRLIAEGVLEPSGGTPEEWRFGGDSLRRARVALHLALDLDINTPGVALALDLIEEIDVLNARLRRTGRR